MHNTGNNVCRWGTFTGGIIQISYLWDMTTAESKLDLLQMIIESEDQSFIKKLTSVARSLKKQKSGDWADEVPEHVIDELFLSIDEAQKGDAGISHAQMLAEAKKDFPKLKLR